MHQQLIEISFDILTAAKSVFSPCKVPFVNLLSPEHAHTQRLLHMVNRLVKLAAKGNWRNKDLIVSSSVMMLELVGCGMKAEDTCVEVFVLCYFYMDFVLFSSPA